MRDLNNTTEMNSIQISESLKLLTKIKRPAFVWGKPGVGKSSVMQQVADDLGYSFMDIRLSQYDPVDLRGLPTVNGEGLTHWATPASLPNEKRDGKNGILFLDEMNGAPQLVQASAYQLILDRGLGEYRLPDGWVVHAAGNREGDKGVTSRMPMPLANRFVHLLFGVDDATWVKWALANDVVTEVIAFIRWRTELLSVFDTSSKEKAFPSPRSWEFVSDIVAGAADPSIEYGLIAGTVGQAAAAEFTGFLRVFRQLPSVDGVLLDPSNASVPTDPATLYALCGGLARKASQSNFDRIVEYAKRLPAEFQVCLVKDSTAHDPEVQQTRAWIQWQSDNSEVMI